MSVLASYREIQMYMCVVFLAPLTFFIPKVNFFVSLVQFGTLFANR